MKFSEISTQSVTALLVAGLINAARAQGVCGKHVTSADPNPKAWFGELHLHTSYSLDAYAGYGVRIGPDEAYSFAQGDAVRGIKRTSPPLDFMAVTDHAEWMGVMNRYEDAGALSRTKKPDRLNTKGWPNKPVPPSHMDIKSISRDSWQRTIEAANRHYKPGRFTTFIAYEWTVNLNPGHLHRNVIFRGSTAPTPFSAIDSDKPEDLWRFLDNVRRTGHEALAIPHNTNVSKGTAFDWFGSDGRPIGEAYARQREINEPLVEISQHKGTSETHPLLSPTDEFSDFELTRTKTDNKRKEGSYVRDALGRGLVLASEAGGINPFKYGFVGGSDFHTGLSESSENNYAGFAGWWGPIELAEPDFKSRSSQLGRYEGLQVGVDPKIVNETAKFLEETSSGALTGVWAVSNTRESIYDALRRKDSFATSGTRLKLRFFASWVFDDTLLEHCDWVNAAYAQGVSMGNDLPPAPTSEAGNHVPIFALWAAKDPNGANLDRIQVIKVWLDKDRRRIEKIYDVALSDGRRIDTKTGRAPPVGNTVNVERSTYRNSIGSTELLGLWRDREFDPESPAVYYLRVLEIPTPRWTTLIAARTGSTRPDHVPATIQERGWSSPIWYTPSSK